MAAQGSERSLLARTTEAPIAFDTERGQAAADAIDVAGSYDLIAGAAGSSSFLNALIQRDSIWVGEALQVSPESRLATLLEPLDDEEAMDKALRDRKRRVALLTALADLGGVWSLEEVTGALTQFADFALETAMARHLGDAVSRGRLPKEAGDDFGGLFAIAMGKMGAAELNYSSDIDLICLFDETRYPPEDYAEIRSGFVRVIQNVVRTLSAQTADGYVFRTDLRLRPDPSVTPVCIGAGVAEGYYESLGRTWERAAMIKARIAAGDRIAGEAFLKNLTPFIWRRHLDYAAIEDAHDMQRRIRDHKGLAGPITLPGHDLKLGRGGIREIEFYVQTRQLINGGRDASLRGQGTLPMLAALTEADLVREEFADELHACYIAHRGLEHRIQMLEDAQTHIIPATDQTRAQLAALCGSEDLATFDSAVLNRLSAVHRITESLYEQFGNRVETIDHESLAALGFAEPEMVLGLLDVWRSGGIAATRSERARAILNRIVPDIVSALAKAASPDDAIRRFDTFLSGLPTGVQILSLFEANPQLLDLLSEICAASPRLAHVLGARASVLDAVLDRDFFEPVPPMETLLAQHEAALSEAPDYESVLDLLRRRDRELRFRAGVQFLRRVISTTELGASLSAIAEAGVRSLLPHVQTQIAARYGPPPGRGAVVVAMGKLGSCEMTISSDLDLLVIYDAAGQTESSGPRVLPATTYYARLTQALVSALSAPTAEGTLYEVDMRLRPSGRKGPVAVALRGFESYQHEEAWTWEHMALTRARIVAGSASIGSDVERVIASVRSVSRDRATLLKDVRDMRARLRTANRTEAANPWDVKLGPGGLMDIELCVQAGMLLLGDTNHRAPGAALETLVAGGFLTNDAAEILEQAISLQTTVQHFGRLAVDGAFDPVEAGAGLVAELTASTGAESLDALRDRLETLTTAAAGIVSDVLGEAKS